MSDKLTRLVLMIAKLLLGTHRHEIQSERWWRAFAELIDEIESSLDD
jgi:hypothetical protein